MTHVDLHFVWEFPSHVWWQRQLRRKPWSSKRRVRAGHGLHFGGRIPHVKHPPWFMDVHGNTCMYKSQTTTKTYTKQPGFSGRAFFCDRKSKIEMIRGWAKPCQSDRWLRPPSPSDSFGPQLWITLLWGNHSRIATFFGGNWWEIDGKLMGNWWEIDGKLMGNWWEIDGKLGVFYIPFLHIFYPVSSLGCWSPVRTVAMSWFWRLAGWKRNMGTDQSIFDHILGVPSGKLT